MLEKKTQDYLEKNGWLVHTAISPPTVFREVNGKKMWINAGKNYDIFNLWDHIAIRKGTTFIPHDEFYIPTEQFDKFMYLDITKDENENGVYRTYSPMSLEIVPNIVFVQTKSTMQYGKMLDKYKDFPYKFCYIFVWEKVKNRYQLTIQKAK